jgi:putative addiction module component (TIGR02574 family)
MAAEQELTAQAMSLPADQRAQLARRLILSLESPDYDADADQLWGREIEQRLAAIDRGEVEPLEWRASIDRIRQSLH